MGQLDKAEHGRAAIVGPHVELPRAYCSDLDRAGRQMRWRSGARVITLAPDERELGAIVRRNRRGADLDVDRTGVLILIAVVGGPRVKVEVSGEVDIADLRSSIKLQLRHARWHGA